MTGPGFWIGCAIGFLAGVDLMVVLALVIPMLLTSRTRPAASASQPTPSRVW